MSLEVGDIVRLCIDNMTCLGRVIKIRSNRVAYVRYYHLKELKFRGLDVFASKLTPASKEEKEKLNQYARAYNRDVTKVSSNGNTENREKIIGSIYIGIDNA